MIRAIFLFVGFLLMLGACTQRMICPAYQSAFIYDQEALRKKFSYFNEDSTPKILTVSRNKYLIIPEASYRKKIRSMKTIEMKPIYPKVPDSLRSDKKNEFEGAEKDANDSTAKAEPKDSVYVITKDREVRMWKYDKDSMKYHVEHIPLNSDQDNYMWYFRDLLVLPDVRAALEDQKNAKEANAASAKKTKTGFFGFFKNLFKKKAKPDSAALAKAQALPPDSLAANNPPPEKKGIFGFLKKKKKADAGTSPDKKKDPAKKENDGFE